MTDTLQPPPAPEGDLTARAEQWLARFDDGQGNNQPEAESLVRELREFIEHQGKASALLAASRDRWKARVQEQAQQIATVRELKFVHGPERLPDCDFDQAGGPRCVNESHYRYPTYAEWMRHTQSAVKVQTLEAQLATLTQERADYLDLFERAIAELGATFPGLKPGLIDSCRQVRERAEAAEARDEARALELAQALKWWGAYDWAAMLAKVAEIRSAENKLIATQTARLAKALTDLVAAEAQRDDALAILDQAPHAGDCWSWDCATCGWLCLGDDEHGSDHQFVPRKCNCFKSRI